jgi:L-fuconate dehydratase
MVDANHVWEVDEAIDWMRDLAFAEPWFVEEPTSPDEIEGHRRIRDAVSPVKVATGEMCQNRILFKQFICTSISSIPASSPARPTCRRPALAIRSR